MVPCPFHTLVRVRLCRYAGVKITSLAHINQRVGSRSRLDFRNQLVRLALLLRADGQHGGVRPLEDISDANPPAADCASPKTSFRAATNSMLIAGTTVPKSKSFPLLQ